MKDGAPIEQRLRERIREEASLRASRSDTELQRRISSGDLVEARGDLLHFTAPARLPARVEKLLSSLDAQVAASSLEEKAHLLQFLTLFSIDLATFVPWWAGPKRWDRSQIEETLRVVLQRLDTAVAREPAEERALLARLRADELARLKAEGVADDAEAARLAGALTGNGLLDFARSLIREAAASNLTAAAKARLNGGLETEIGNDYAAFLQRALWLGASFVTTNPVLIKLAWDLDPPYWNRQVDGVISSHFSRLDLAAIDCPTMVLVGEHDRLTPPDLAAEIADGIPAA